MVCSGRLLCAFIPLYIEQLSQHSVSSWLLLQPRARETRRLLLRVSRFRLLEHRTNLLISILLGASIPLAASYALLLFIIRLLYVEGRVEKIVGIFQGPGRWPDHGFELFLISVESWSARPVTPMTFCVGLGVMCAFLALVRLQQVACGSSVPCLGPVLDVLHDLSGLS